jgi:hypothetical protein
VVDISRLPNSSPIITYVGDVEELQAKCDEDVSEDVAARLFLVEDLSQPVAKVMGGKFQCHPHLFENHLHTVGYRTCMETNSIGELTDETDTITHCFGKPQSVSEISKMEFFSLPFYRAFNYPGVSTEDIEPYRTVYRNLYDGNYLEERVSGVLYTDAGFSYDVGQCV